jgi:uroporphyrinogen-III synthase
VSADAPLAGRGVAVTRGEGPDGELSRLLARAGARVLAWPAIAIVEPTDPEPLATALAELVRFDWVAFTSANAVAAVASRLPGGAKLPPAAAVGAATAAAARAAGFEVRVEAARAGARSLVEAWSAAVPLAGARVLWPAGAAAEAALSTALAARGATPVRVEAYRTVAAPLDGARFRAELERGEVDAVAFASPSAVANLARAFAPAPLAVALGAVAAISIGETTTAALRAYALEAAAEAAPSTFEGLVAATIVALAGRRDP